MNYYGYDISIKRNSGLDSTQIDKQWGKKNKWISG